MQHLRYHISNWSDYNKSLIQRGNITFWLEDGALKHWFSSKHTCRAGHPLFYSDEAMLLILTLREIFKLPLRALQGFVSSIFSMIGVSLPVPSYTQISRRAKALHKKFNDLPAKAGKSLNYLLIFLQDAPMPLGNQVLKFRFPQTHGI